MAASGLAQNQIGLTLAQTTRLFKALPAGGLPEMPQGFNGKPALDGEGFIVLADGSRSVSDEYGPSIYRYSAAGQFIEQAPSCCPEAVGPRPVSGSESAPAKRALPGRKTPGSGP